MKLIDEALLAKFREAKRCEWCGAKSHTGLDPHHVRTKGAGRVDVKENLVSLCRYCHNSHHDGNEPTAATLLSVVAQRERKTVEEIREVVDAIRRDQSQKVKVVG